MHIDYWDKRHASVRPGIPAHYPQRATHVIKPYAYKIILLLKCLIANMSITWLVGKVHMVAQRIFRNGCIGFLLTHQRMITCWPEIC
jgi:hypothetical protein